MKKIVITMPQFIENEATYIDILFKSGLKHKVGNTLQSIHIDLLHFRKPDASIEDCEQLIQAIDPRWYPRIVIHDHFELCEKYHLHGIHLNHRNHEVPKGFQGSISRSCHSLDEVVEHKASCNYVFLSPIFDSISKQGYQHAFSDKALAQAANDKIIDTKVFALGGVTLEKLPLLEAWHFGGAAMLGAAWKQLITKK